MAPPPRILELQALLSQTDWVRNLARKLVRDPHLADDLAQAACLAALRHRPASDRSLRAWLGTVLRNLVRQDARAGERITINVIQGNSRNESPRVPILEGTSDVLTVTDSAVTLVLYLGNTEVTRMPLELAPGELNKVRL